jgi:predicted nucleotidyltransferase
MNVSKTMLEREDDSSELDSIVTSIVRYKRPSRIILFGSRARREVKGDSDIDLCVIYDRMPKRNLEVLQELYRELYSVDSSPVDLVVYDEPGFIGRSGKPNSLESRILNEGVSLYGSP